MKTIVAVATVLRLVRIRSRSGEEIIILPGVEVKVIPNNTVVSVILNEAEAHLIEVGMLIKVKYKLSKHEGYPNIGTLCTD